MSQQPPLVVDFARYPDYPNHTTGHLWARINLSVSNQWISATYGSKLNRWTLIANSGVGNRVAYSSDLLNWTVGVSPADYLWRRVRYGGGYYVAVSKSGGADRAMYSSDGINWTLGAGTAANQYEDLAYSPTLGRWAAISQNGAVGTQVMTSDDNGANWVQRVEANNLSWMSMCWSPSLSLFVAVASSGVGNRVMTSSDGINWVARVSAADNNWTSVVWSSYHQLFIAVANSGVGNRVMTSPDGINWTIGISAAVDVSQESLAVSPNGILVSVCDTGGAFIVNRSVNGTGWIESSNYPAAARDLKDVSYGQGKFVAADIGQNCIYVS